MNNCLENSVLRRARCVQLKDVITLCTVQLVQIVNGLSFTLYVQDKKTSIFNAMEGIFVFQNESEVAIDKLQERNDLCRGGKCGTSECFFFLSEIEIYRNRNYTF